MTPGASALCPNGHAGSSAFLTVYWFALDQPQEATTEASKSLVLEDMAGRRGRGDRVGACPDSQRGTQKTDRRKSGGSVANTVACVPRFFRSPQMMFNIADAHVSALLLAGQMADGSRSGRNA